MANLDPARAALVLREYRITTVENAGIKALYPNAREIIIDTNLDSTGGAQLATELFAATSAKSNAFELEVEGAMYLDDFTDGPPRFVISFARHPAAGTNVVYTVVGASIDYETDRTTLMVRA